MPSKNSIFRLLLICAAIPVCAIGAVAGNFDFRAAPDITLNRVYRVDTITGQMGACQYGLKEGAVGATLCYPSGEGAGAQEPGEYALISSGHQKEGGVFRLNRRTGKMSICFVLNDQVVCTPQG